MKNRILLFILSFLAFQGNAQTPINILFNSGFDAPAVPNNGENYTGSYTFNGWTMTGGPFNVIRPNGSYGPGPDNAQDGAQFVEVYFATGTVYQDFTIDLPNTAIEFGGYFSSRTGQPYAGYVEIRSMPSNTLVSTSSSVQIGSGNVKNWTKSEGSVTLPVGNYRYVAYIHDDGNFDAAYVNGVVNALPCIWDGSVGNWSDGTKWFCGHAPTLGEDAFVYNGTVTLSAADVQIANLTLSGGTLTGDKDLTLSGGLNWRGGIINGTGALTVAGLVSITNTVRLDNRTLTMNGGGTLIGTVYWYSTSGTIIIPVNKTLICVTSTNTQEQNLIGSTLINQGIIEKNGMGYLGLDIGVLTNTGTININQGRLKIGYRGGASINHTGAVINIADDAVCQHDCGSESFTNCTITATGVSHIGLFLFTNDDCLSYGTVNFISGNIINAKLNSNGSTYNLSQNITLSDFQGGGTVNGSGTLTIPVGGTSSGGTFNCPLVNQGTINSVDANNTFINSGFISNLTAKNTFVNTGTMGGYQGLYDLTNATSVINTGTIAPGSFDLSAPIGYLVMTPFVNSNATLAIQLAGTNNTPLNSNGYDQLTIGSATTLGGTLNISFINGFTPAINDVFTIMTATGAFSGNFSSIVSPISNTTMWQVDITTNPNEVRIKLVTIAPIVCTWTGAVNNNWNNVGNWSCGHVPIATDNVVINQGIGATVIIDDMDVQVANLTLNEGSLIVNKNIDVTGTLMWSYTYIGGTGTMTVALPTTVTLPTTIVSTPSLACTLILNGGGTIAGKFNTFTGANLIIPISKTLTITNDYDAVWGGNDGILTILGTLVKGGTGILECNAQNFQNTGTVNVTAGILRMAYGGAHNGATFNTTRYNSSTQNDLPTFCSFSGGTHTITGCNILGTGGFAAFGNTTISTFTGNTVGTSLFNIGGSCAFNLGQEELNLNSFGYFSTGTLTGTGNITTNSAGIYSGSLDFTGNLNIGSLTWSGGTIGSMVHTTLPPGSVGTTSNTVTTNGRFTINGILTIQSGIFNCNRFDNNDGDMTIQSGTVNANGGEFGNFGRLTLQTGTFNANADFYNANTLTIQTGTFVANNAFINSADLIIESGTLNAVGAFTNEFGTVEVRQAGILNTASTFIVTGGRIKGRGTLNLNSTLINKDDGIISPGLSPGTLTINLSVPSTVTPSVTNNPTGSMEMEIVNGGTLAMPTMTNDLLKSTGNIQLAGTLNILTSGEIPIGTYTIIQSTSGTVSGVFTNAYLDGSGLPVGVTINYGANSVSVIVTSVLSVELLDFKAKLQNDIVELNWQTAIEQNVRDFTIERSANGQKFTPLSTHSPKGSHSTYFAFDKNSFVGNNYYRLKINELDNKSSYSKVAHVHRLGKGFTVKAYPNPFDNDLTIEIATDKKTDVQIELIDILGRQVFQKNSPNTEESLLLPISISHLPNGSYFLKVWNGQQTIQQKLMKN